MISWVHYDFFMSVDNNWLEGRQTHVALVWWEGDVEDCQEYVSTTRRTIKHDLGV